LKLENYQNHLKNYNKTSKEDIHKFINSFISEHSWYKHLSNERSHLFYFFISPPKDNNVERCEIKYIWNNLISWDGDIKSELDIKQILETNYNLPIQIIEIGEIKLSKFIHSAFLNSTTYFLENETRQSFAELHEEIIRDLEIHLGKMIDFVFP